MAGKRLLEVVIAGDPKGVLGAFAATEAGADRVGSKMGGLGMIAAASGVAVVAGVAGAGLALFELGEKFQQATNTIRVKTGETGTVLEGLKTSFDNIFSQTPASMTDVANTLSTLHQKLGETGAPLEALSLQFIRLSRITKTDLNENIKAGTDAFNNWGITAEKQPALMDELFRASQQSGVSFATLAGQLDSAGPVLRGLGFDVEHSAALLATLGKAGVDVSDVMPALSKSLATAAKHGQDAGSLFQETFDKIKSSPSAIDAAGIALQVFGARAGPKMAELIREGKLSYEDMLKSIGQGDTIQKAATDTASWTAKLEILKHQVEVALKPLAEKVFQGITSALLALAPHITQFIKWMSEQIPIAFAAIQPMLARFGEAIRVVAVYIGTTIVPALVQFGRWLLDHKPILEGVAVVIGGVLVAAFVGWAISAGAAAVATVVAIAPVIAVGAALAALAAGIIYAYQNFDTFRNVVDNVASFLRDTAWPAMKAVFDAIVVGVQAVITFATDNWHVIADAFSTAVDAFKVAWDSTLKPLLEIIRTLFKDVWDFIAGWVENKINMVRDVVNTVMALFHGDWGAAWDGIKSLFIDAWTGIWDALMGVWNLMQDWFSQLGPRVVGLIGNIGGLLYDKGIELMDGLRAGVGDAWGALAAWLASVPSMIVSFLADLPGLLYDAGVAAGEALARGVGSAIANIPSMIHDAITPHLPDILTDSGSGGGINSGPQIGHNAAGTSSWGGGLTWVGERGPELVRLPGGTQIWNAQQSAALASSAAAIPNVSTAGDDKLTVPQVAQAHQAQHDVMHDIGIISDPQYLVMLQSRLAVAEAAGQKYSAAWYSIWQSINRIDQQAVTDAKTVGQEHQTIHDDMFAAGALSADQYLVMLKKRLAGTQQYSAEWLSIWQKIKSIQDQQARDEQTKAKDAENAAKAIETAKTVAENHQLELLRNEVKFGAATKDALVKVLTEMQSHLEKYSNAWVQLQSEIDGLSGAGGPIGVAGTAASGGGVWTDQGTIFHPGTALVPLASPGTAAVQSIGDAFARGVTININRDVWGVDDLHRVIRDALEMRV